MSSFYAVMLFFLPVELLLQIPYPAAGSLGGFIGSLLERPDFLAAISEFGLKFVGLAASNRLAR
ncbi:hypothetical protein [uncultured Muribaculum sp.]|uniref:hypothetical protein n=1 Tax=uncultured Muribaculum sp. TaxID=1918613 RepID=UPI00263AAAAA|nr:hypothetical protein [uncultured Muribaculum sp.]